MHFSGGQIPVADLVFLFICFLRKKMSRKPQGTTRIRTNVIWKIAFGAMRLVVSE